MTDYCFDCNKECEYETIKKDKVFKMSGHSDITIEIEVPICQECGGTNFIIPKLRKRNRIKRHDKYREIEEHGEGCKYATNYWGNIVCSNNEHPYHEPEDDRFICYCDEGVCPGKVER